MKIEAANYKDKILIEQAEQAGMSVFHYINHSAENDPGFFRWLFGHEAREYNDFVCPDVEEFKAFREDASDTEEIA